MSPTSRRVAGNLAPLVLRGGAETGSLDLEIVDNPVVETPIRREEPDALSPVKPLHSPLGHLCNP